MPAVITLAATFAAAAVGGGVIISTAIFYGVSAALTIGVSLGLSALSNMLMKRNNPAPKPEDVQQSVKQPAQPRARHYGRVKISGPWVFAESKAGDFYKVIALGQGPLDAIEQYWIDDEQVTLDGGGFVNAGPRQNRIVIQSRLGATPSPAYSLSGIFPEWTSAHRGDAVASLMVRQRGVLAENYLKIYPNGINTSYRVVARGAQIYNPVTEATAWNDNAAAVILDYMRHDDGMRLPSSIFTTPLAIEAWQAAYARAAELVDLAASGTESRYRLWGSYLMNERPADVLGRMLACCDARIYPTTDGGIAVNIGDWSEPTVTLDADSIVGFSDVARGYDIMTTANTVRATYLGVDQDYQTADADPWVDAVDVSDRGEIEADLAFIMSPSHAQTRRLMKLAAHRLNPNWVGTFQCNLRGLAALGERFVRVTILDIDEVFEVQDFRFVLGDGGILQGVTVSVISLPETAYSWDETQEEGDAPVSEDTVVDRTIPIPDPPTVSVEIRTIGGVSASYSMLSFPAAPSDSLSIQARGRLTTDASWTTIAVEPSATSATGFIIGDVGEYEFQLRYVTLTTRVGDWSDSAVIVAYPSLDFSVAYNSQYFPLLIGV